MFAIKLSSLDPGNWGRREQLTLSYHHGSSSALTAAFLLLLRQHDKLTEDLILIGSAEGTFLCVCVSVHTPV